MQGAQTIPLLEQDQTPLERALSYPRFRYMGSKYDLLPWIYQVLSQLRFQTALDAFSGSGVVAYLLKAMGATVTANDHLQFAYHLAHGLVANPGVTLSPEEVAALLRPNPRASRFIEETFRDIFFTPEDLRFLDEVWANLEEGFPEGWKRSFVLAALFRAALKKQPRGVFTVAKDRAARYDDGRRDIRLSLRELFLESLEAFSKVVYDDGRTHHALNSDVFELPTGFDLVYLDPPYVPRRDDNCYIKRYHFLEGLASYWRGAEILPQSKVRKIKKRWTPFSYRRTALEAFDRLFALFADSTLLLSYSSNGYPDLDILVNLMKKYKAEVEVFERDHLYHYGTHKGVQPNRARIKEYLILGLG